MDHFDPQNGVSDGLTQQQLLETLGIKSGGWGDYRQWGAILSHRQACVRYLRNSLFALLEDPAMTRRRLKLEFTTIAKTVEEKGPPD